MDRYSGGGPGSAAACVLDIDGGLPEELPCPRADTVVELQEKFVVPVDVGHHSSVQELAEFAGKGLVEFCNPAAPPVNVAEVAFNLDRQVRLTASAIMVWRSGAAGPGWSLEFGVLERGNRERLVNPSRKVHDLRRPSAPERQQHHTAVGVDGIQRPEIFDKFGVQRLQPA